MRCSRAATGRFRPASAPPVARALIYVLALTTPLFSCGGDSHAGRELVFDLAAGFDSAQIRVETDRIDFALPDARRQRLDGWSQVESAKAKSWIWSDGPTSRLRLFFTDASERVLVMRCHPFNYPDAPRQVMSIELNGAPIGELKLETGAREYRVILPEGVVRIGDNDLLFRYSDARMPAEVLEKSGDRRELAVAWEWLQVEGEMPPPPPDVWRVDGRDVLVLPAGTRVDYYFELPRDGAFTFDSVSWFAPTGSEAVSERGVEKTYLDAAEGDQDHPVLRVEIEEDAQPGRVVRNLPSLRGPTTVELGSGRARLVRLSLSAASRLGALVTNPVIHASAPSHAEPVTAPISRSQESQPNVVLYVVDTLRAKSLGVYGSDRGTSPHIDEFARSASVFEVARANTAWTRPGVASILTGLTPWQHRTNGIEDRLADRTDTLAETLRDAGYETAAFLTNGNVSENFGFAQGFDTFVLLKEDLERRSVHQSAGDLHDTVVDWLEKRHSDRPLFLYLHATDPHAPYAPIAPYLERFAADSGDSELHTLDYVVSLGRHQRESTALAARRLEALYDAEIAYLDEEFGRVMDALDQRFSLLDDAVVVLTSDHGEEFLEHGGWQHGKSLYEELLRIPLVMRFPGAPSGEAKPVRSSVSAQQIDIYPTVLSAVGVAAVASQGVDLRAAETVERPAVALLEREGRRLEGIVDRGFKLMVDRTGGGGLRRGAARLLFDLEQDPDELHDLAHRRPVMAGYLDRLLREHELSRGAEDADAVGVSLSRETEETLRALGYIE